MADSGYSSGGGGNDWEVVSLTASTYAAAPGPVLPLPPPLLDAHDNRTELPPPSPPPAIFMSQHFNLPPADEHESLLPLNGCQQQESAPVTPKLDDDDDLRMLFFAENDGEKGIQDDPLTSSGGMSACCSAGQERQTVLFPAPPPPGFQSTQPEAAGSDHTRSTPVSAADAASSTDGIVTVVDSASLAAAAAARAVPVVAGAAAPKKEGASSSRIPCEAHAWWNKTFSFLRDNSRESLTFRFIFVAATVVGLAVLGQRDKLQLRLEFNVDTQKISCAVSEPLGQVKLNMLVGGSHVAHG